jgi:cytochrome b pre-mRNA-processing protein 3
MKLFARIFGRADDPREQLRPLWHRVVAIAREKRWYAEHGVADTLEGRFDMITAVLAMVMLRMETNVDLARDTALLMELFVEDMDDQLREAGVGDPVVGKHVGRLVGSLGGRIDAYRGGIDGGPQAMAEAVGRNVTLAEGASAAGVADGLLVLWRELERTGDGALLAGDLPRG